MRLRLTDSVRADVSQILSHSAHEFGAAAADRYRMLIATALRDVADDPLRPGSVDRPELADQARSWHLRLSRRRTGTAAVNRPRHFIIYRVADECVVIGRLLHDAMELERHVDRDDAWD